MKKKIPAITKRAAIILSVTVIFLEIGLRIFGYGVFKLSQFSSISDPNRHVTPDPTLGIHLTPGDFKVTLNHHLKYTATHLKNGQRTCGGTENKSSEQTTIALYGCSFTYGTGVNDWETYPYLVQQKFPKLNIENHAVPGYGQAQMLLRIEKDINSVQKPDAIILNYLSFHNERNTMNALYRQRIRIGFENTKRDDLEITKLAFNYPSGIMENETLRIGQVSIGEITSTFPLIRYSAIRNSLQNFCDVQSLDPLEDEKVTIAIIDRIHEICKKRC